MKFGDEINLNFCQFKKWPSVEIFPKQKKPAHNCSNPSIFCGAMGCGGIVLTAQGTRSHSSTAKGTTQGILIPFIKCTKREFPPNRVG